MLHTVIRASMDRASIASPVLEDVALSPTGADLGDDGQDDVLGGHALAELATDVDGHGAEGLERQRLGRQDVLHLRRADAEGERAEGAVRRRVAVAAHHGHARLGQAELRADDMDDALLDVAHRVQPDPELLTVAAQRVHLHLRDRVGDRAGRRRDVVVLRGQGEVRTPDRATASRRPSNAWGLVTSCRR